MIYSNLFKIPSIACALNDRDVLTLESSQLESADIIELRVDMFENIEERHILKIFRTVKERLNKPIIATIRDTSEGGQKEIKDRINLYKIVLPFSDFIDIEINSDIYEDIKKLCAENRKTLIGSYHNFLFTPDNNALEEIFLKGKNSGCDIVKIAVMPNNKEDMLRLIEFTLKHRKDPIITMSMGEIGLPTRVFNPIFGSLITYGYINTPSAPGQLSIREISQIFKMLKVR
jgi:3-dehydroquinate dehydratase-1